jgi:murein L,D-transpeptidase YcbB/YkuD
LLKFNVPNEYDIHLHDTPLTASFQRSMRALSHGCVRLSKPKELAAWLLGPQGWSGETIESVLDASETRRVPVERSVPVHVLYLTAFVDAEGAVNFRQDIYGRDDEAMLALSAPAQPVQMAKDGKVGCGPAG